MTRRLPNPGSKEAIKKGCTCPIKSNCYGKGFAYNEKKERVFWIQEDCPIHSKKNKRKNIK